MGNSNLNTTEASADLAALLERATPGPWTIPNAGSIGNNLFVSHTIGDVGAISKNLALVHCRRTWRAEGQANAALIALAPDLAAEVLRLRVEARETALQYLSDTGQMSERIDELTAANAALAADNARLGKRVDAGLRLVDSAVNGLWDDEALVTARAWLAGGAE